MRIQINARWRTIRTLASAVEMNPQTLLHVVIEISVGRAGIADAEISGPTLQIPIQILNESGIGLKQHRLPVMTRSAARSCYSTRFHQAHQHTDREQWKRTCGRNQTW